MGLFVLGKFKSHAGFILDWKIDCDTLTEKDLKCLAKIIASKVGLFDKAYGIPRGGTRLAKELDRIRYGHNHRYETILLVDDVLTTGNSMKEAKKEYLSKHPHIEVKGAVIFARGKCPHWVTPIFKLSED